MITMSSIISQYFNSSRNLNLTMPLCCISNFIMFPRSCNFFNGKKYLRLKLSFSPQVYNQFGKSNQAIGVQDLNCNFVILEIFLEIRTIVMDFEKIVELLESQLNPKSKTQRRNKNLMWMAMCRRAKHYMIPQECSKHNE